MADETIFAGLRRLHLGDGLDEAFLYGNPTVIDRLLRVGAVTHRHDGHAALADPVALVPAIATDDVGGTIPSDTSIYVGVTFLDADSGETVLSDTDVITTRPALETPSIAPSLDAITHVAGSLLANNYTYALTVVDGLGGETPLGPAITVTVPPGFANSSIELSGLSDAVVEVGGTGWRLWRQVGGGQWGLVDDGVADALVDDGSFCIDCDVEPPATGTTFATSVLRVTVPGPAPALAATFSVYASVDGDFSSPCLLGNYPVADLGVEKVYTALDLQDGAPPAVNLSLPGADLIDPDTELLDFPWRRPVANAAALPVDATEGDVRITLDDGVPHRFVDGVWGEWAMGSGGTGIGPLETAMPIWQEDSVDVGWLRTHKRTAPNVERINEEFTGAAASIGDGYARDGADSAIPEAGANNTNAIHYLPYDPVGTPFYNGFIERTVTIASLNWTRIGVTLGNGRTGLFAWITAAGALEIATRVVDSNLEADFTVIATEPLPDVPGITDTYNIQLYRAGNDLQAVVHVGKAVIAELDATVPVPLRADYGSGVDLQAGLSDRWSNPDAWTTDLFRAYTTQVTYELYVNLMREDGVMQSFRLSDGIGDVFSNLGSQVTGVYSANWADDIVGPPASYLRSSERMLTLSGRSIKFAGAAGPALNDVIVTLDEEATPLAEVLAPVVTGDADGVELGMVRITTAGEIVWLDGRSTDPVTKTPFVSFDGITYQVA